MWLYEGDSREREEDLEPGPRSIKVLSGDV